MDAVKLCARCGQHKPRTEYYKHPKMRDGLLNKCKPCARFDARANRLERSEYYREYDRHRYHNNNNRKDGALKSFRASHLAHPERKRAADMTAIAVRKGLIKKQPCWVCGEKAQAHHPDYSAPLDVVWLCVMHHRQAHGIVRRMDEGIAA